MSVWLPRRCPTSTKSTTPATTVSDVKTGPPAPKEPAPAPLATRVWKKVKHEAQHYWHGSKLLVSEVRISSRLQWKILQGDTLTRRERRQLKRTTQDLMRLVPFAVFIIVPFMEFLLPVALKLFRICFPQPSKTKKQRKLLRVRLDMAKFLQETLRESGLKANAHIVGTEAFKEFFRKVRSTGESPSASDIINVAKLFDDDLTLDNLSRPQWCPCLWHLPARLRDELTTWISLHLHDRVSGVLLVLGRAFNFDRKFGEDEDGKTAVISSLESVLCGLPDNLLNEAELEVDSEKASYKQKLDVLQQQQELIDDEAEQEQKEEDARRAKREAEAELAQELLPDSELLPEVTEPENARMTAEQLKELSDALLVLSSKSSVLKERDELRTLMEENLQAEEVRVPLRISGTPADPCHHLVIQDPKSPSGALTKRIRSMLAKIDTQLQEYDNRVGSSLQLISADPQGRISVQDLETALAVIKHRPDDEISHAVIQKLDVDQDGFVELEHVLGLVKEEGLGILLDDEAQSIIGQGKELKNSKPRKEDIVQE
ncbi:LETM1-like protein-domain-containing protein [Flammula alnicola]|nr:LETM1-like protein-domain-containing protein [Flammula alnicola]